MLQMLQMLHVAVVIENQNRADSLVVNVQTPKDLCSNVGS